MTPWPGSPPCAYCDCDGCPLCEHPAGDYDDDTWCGCTYNPDETYDEEETL